MLRQLSIRNIVLIASLDLAFDKDLTVLTGETGAGKSILLDALSLATGGRGDGSLVRSGEAQGTVTAVFDMPLVGPVSGLLEESAIEIEDNLILKRVQSADGRSRASINDQTCSVSLLRQVGRHLVEIHGQHDDRALVDASEHRRLLDVFADLGDVVEEVRHHYELYRAAEKLFDDQMIAVEEARKEADYLAAASAELEALNPEPGEEDALSEKRQRMMSAEKVAGDLQDGHALLSSETGIGDLSMLLRRLERKSELAEELFAEPIEMLSRAIDALSDAEMSFAGALRDCEFDPNELESAETRLFSLRAAARKYQVQVDALPDLTVRMSDNLALIDAGEASLRKLEKDKQDALKIYQVSAASLSALRAQAGVDLSKRVNEELPELKLENASFLVQLESDETRQSVDGFDIASFFVQTNPGTDPGPMMKVASGGELSRFLLALKVSLADKGSAPTLIFDEIDSGVGGAVADAIGARLARLADTVQVLSVTHAPQVAVCAAVHFLISKSNDNEDTMSTDVTKLSKTARQEEVARMLSGRDVTKEARAAARRLLKGA